ncbi:creatininase family protein [Paenibacillus sp. IITD108]|uniref:creatininase family protein n=1 Tax=Paenibacillus sp. IITD108 TaxID=3116649 RepID=UPI002F4116AD
MNAILFHSCTREELSTLAQEGCPVVIPLAATEQHGPHLPVFTDSLISEYISKEAVQQASSASGNPFLLAPIVSIGCSQHHIAFGGTISFRSTTYLAMLHDILESLVSCGFTNIIMLNCHGGNEPVMLQAVNDMAVKHKGWFAAASYWNLIPSSQKQQLTDVFGPTPGHAGAFETSAIMAIQPDWINDAAISDQHHSVPWHQHTLPNTFLGKQGTLTGFDGYTDSAIQASREKGQWALDQIVIPAVSEWLQQMAAAMKVEV